MLRRQVVQKGLTCCVDHRSCVRQGPDLLLTIFLTERGGIAALEDLEVPSDRLNELEELLGLADL